MITSGGQECFIREQDLRDKCPESDRALMLESMKKSERFKPLADAFVDGTDLYEFDTKEGIMPGQFGGVADLIGVLPQSNPWKNPQQPQVPSNQSG
jgi:hypothetical protein